MLGLLHQLGYVRYRSTEDQISDTAVERVRDAVRQGVTAPPVAPAVEPKTSGRRQQGADDWMAKLVPGVVRRDREEHELGVGQGPAPRRAPAREKARPPAASPAPSRRVEPAPADALEVQRAELEAERARIESLKAELVAARAQIERARVELAAAREEVERVRYDLEQERIELAAHPAPSGAVSLVELLEARGLRGSDEQQRALGALAAGRHLGAVLPDLHVLDPARARRILDDRLVLVAGEVPAALQGVAAITVAPDRAELPDAREIDRLLSDVGEQLLLNGLRRLVVVNSAPRWQKLIREGLDRRVDVSFRPVPPADAEPGLSRVDAVVLWRVDLPDEQRKSWSEAAGRLLSIADPSLGAFLHRLRDRLRSG